MIRFEDVLNEVVRIIETEPFAQDLISATIVRDLKGRVRLILEFPKDPDGKDVIPGNWSSVCQILQNKLSTQLGPYWGEGSTIWRLGANRKTTHEAVEKAICNQRQLWTDAPTSLSNLAWYTLERTFSKSSWLMRQSQPPWTLEDPSNPAIISFYSFKGGVGRTTALAAVAVLLARAGRRVVVIDLDLEAPGVGTFLLSEIFLPDTGMVDYLLESELQGQPPANIDIYGVVQNDTRLIGVEGGQIRVFTAGRLTHAYLEKIARLDFEKFVTENHNPLHQFLEAIRNTYRPEFILLDVRSGLHDLGGLSLNGLSHLDVIFSLDTPQGWDGLKIILSLLGKRSPRSELFLVHSMVPPIRYDPQVNERFRDKAYELLQRFYFREDETILPIDDPAGPYGIPIPYNEALMSAVDFQQVESTLTARNSAYFQLARLIGTYVQKETVE